MGGSCSNICEAINNEITVYAPKRNNFNETYDIRVNLALLIHNEGPEIIIKILHQLQLPISIMTTTYLLTKQENRIKKKEKRKETATKDQRMKSKTKKRNRGKKITNEEHTYKGGTIPEDEDDGESLQENHMQREKERRHISAHVNLRMHAVHGDVHVNLVIRYVMIK